MKIDKINSMGSQVEEGYRCKPAKVDRLKPIMFYKTHILICTGERCSKGFCEERVDTLRDLTKSMGLNRGPNRIKLSRGNCFGACRFRSVLVLYKNPILFLKDKLNLINASLWLSQIQKFSEDDWKYIFDCLAKDLPIQRENTIPMTVY